MLESQRDYEDTGNDYVDKFQSGSKYELTERRSIDTVNIIHRVHEGFVEIPPFIGDGDRQRKASILTAGSPFGVSAIQSGRYSPNQ